MVHVEDHSIHAGKQNGFTNSSVVVIGAGFSGMCMAIKMLEDGIQDFVIIEKSTGFGGTWRDNIYPGCCCDILSRLYCYSFDQNPNWSRLYPEQEEILSYMNSIARKYDLYSFVRFRSEATGAKWEQSTQQWKVSIQVQGGKEAEFCNNYTIGTNFIISGVGQLNEPYRPEIPGENTFKGKIMHSARWDWSYDFRGKRVGIIGNGATAVQIVPEIAKIASHLTVFQRSPNWIIPRLNADVPEWKRTLLKNVPLLLRYLRADTMRGREAYFQSLVQRESATSAEITHFCQNYIQSQLPDHPELWKILTPDYPPGCKRILLSDEYYPSLGNSHVSLETRPIERITPAGILLKPNGASEDSVDLDLIIFATGFQTREFLHGIEVHGVGNRSLDQIWKSGANALYGVAAESMPNFGMLYGPNTNLGHNSIILMIEAQTRYLLTLVREVIIAQKSGRGLSFTPKTARVKEWNQQLQNSLETSSFADPRCTSWYKTDEGLVTNNWSGTVVEYQKMMSKVDWSDFEVMGKTQGRLPTGVKHIGRVVEEALVEPRALIAGATLGVLTAGGFLFRNRGCFGM
ncbi:cyclohexanone monooxygenase [Ilyonectria destructans]|nr:cyclohexanone monooxygenase [Ilyonectria destructans]